MKNRRKQSGEYSYIEAGESEYTPVLLASKSEPIGTPPCDRDSGIDEARLSN